MENHDIRTCADNEILTTTTTNDTASCVRLVSVTPNAEAIILEIARVSSVDQKSGKTGLIKYLIANKHWSPFEMANVCIEINTSRAMAHQILRHRSFSFQEFSQRYQDVNVLLSNGMKPLLLDARSQDMKNRQASHDNMSTEIKAEWLLRQQHVWDVAMVEYNWALSAGIAKEQARAVLPEGMTPTRLYMSGSIRSWIHYCDLRCANGTQREHADIAARCRDILIQELPIIAAACGWTGKK